MHEDTRIRVKHKGPNKNMEVGDLVRKVIALRSQGRNSEAVELCMKGLEEHPLSIDLRCQLGLSCFEIGDEDRARRELEEVVRTIERNRIAFHVLKKICGRARPADAPRDQKQEGGLRDQSPLPPSLVRKTRTFADLYRRQGYMKEALDIYKGLLRENPDDPYLTRVVHELVAGADESKDQKGQKRSGDGRRAASDKDVLDILESWQAAIQRRRK